MLRNWTGAVADLDHVFGRGRQLADQRHLVRRLDQRRQVARARLVAGSTGRSARRSACRSCRARAPSGSSPRRTPADRPDSCGRGRSRRGSPTTSAPDAASPRGAACVPTRRRERLPFSVSMSSSVIVIISSSGCCASVTTTAVMSLVSEAIGRTACEFLLNRTSLVSWSSTRATPDFSSSESADWCRPIIWPNEGLAGSTCIGGDVAHAVATRARRRAPGGPWRGRRSSTGGPRSARRCAVSAAAWRAAPQAAAKASSKGGGKELGNHRRGDVLEGRPRESRGAE